MFVSLISSRSVHGISASQGLQALKHQRTNLMPLQMSYAGSVLTSQFHSAIPIQPLLQHSSHTTSCLQFAHSTEPPTTSSLDVW